MDYRKPAVFGENWSPQRYNVLPYFAAEREVLARPDVRRILEIGCGNGWNMSRFAQHGRVAFGLDAVPERVALAAAHGPALLADGLRLPVGDGCLDMVYVQHVLHHIGDVARALAEARRGLRPGGVLFLVETVEDNPLIRWGRRLYPKWLDAEITRQGVADRVILPGFVDDADLPALYSAADLFVFPSLYEGFGLPLLEAMACGVPVISSDASSLPEVAATGGEPAAWLLPPGDEAAWSAAMLRLLTDDAAQQRLVAAGAAQAARFTWAAAARQLLGLYERLLARI